MTGANQGIDLTAKAVLNKGDKVIVESPSFIGSLNAFRTYEAELFGVTVEADGMNMDELEETLKNTDGVKMIYTIPTFQNPTGCTTAPRSNNVRCTFIFAEHVPMINRPTTATSEIIPT